MDKNLLIERMEEALESWEDRCAIYAARRRMLTKTTLPAAPFDHAHEFRTYLLESVNDGRPFGWIDPRFLVPLKEQDPEGSERAEQALTHLRDFPWALSVWNRSSRRVFHVTSELSRLLEATSLEGLRWDDVDWPFPGFVVTLDDPLIDKGVRYDCLLAHTTPLRPGDHGNVVHIMMFSNLPRNHMPFHRQARIRMEWLVGQKNWKEADKAFRRWNRQWAKNCQQTGKREGIEQVCFLHEELQGQQVTTPVQVLQHGKPSSCTSFWGLYDRVVRLVINLCTYFATLPPQARPAFNRRPAGTQARKRKTKEIRITDEAEICTVTAEHFLTREERVSVIQDLEQNQDKGGYTLPVHWRRAHSRRERGHGGDPHAPRTVKVRATLVNRHLLQPGEMPGGSKTILGWTK